MGDEGVVAIGQHLTGLYFLHLSYNKRITTVAPLANLPLLMALDVADTGVTDLSPLKSFVLAGLPVKFATTGSEAPGIFVKYLQPKHPPVEIIERGREAMLNYFGEIEAQGVNSQLEAKLLIVGKSGAGKTSLLRRMFRPDLDLPREDESTRGIDILRHEFPLSDGHTFRLNAWDFGGKQLYHATHQFFLTKRSLYVLVNDPLTDDQSIHDEEFEFWLEAVAALCERSPLLIFQNDKGVRCKPIDEPGIKERFPNFVGRYHGNLENAGAADGLRLAVEHLVQKLPHLGEPLPANWLPIHEDLTRLAAERPYISEDEYFAIYGRHLGPDHEKAFYLSQYFHDVGVLLHFQQQPELRRTVFLQNQWLTEAVFRILDDESVKAQRGRFTLADCDRLWSEEGYSNKDVELRALMLRFELGYRLPATGDETWLVPQHLSPSKPTELSEWAQPGDLVLTYRYKFLPRGLVSRLIVRMNRYVKQPDLCWSTGSLFEHGETQVLVETTLRTNEIVLRSRGPEKQGADERHRQRPGQLERQLSGTQGQSRKVCAVHLPDVCQFQGARGFRIQVAHRPQEARQTDNRVPQTARVCQRERTKTARRHEPGRLAGAGAASCRWLMRWTRK